MLKFIVVGRRMGVMWRVVCVSFIWVTMLLSGIGMRHPLPPPPLGEQRRLDTLTQSGSQQSALPQYPSVPLSHTQTQTQTHLYWKHADVWNIHYLGTCLLLLQSKPRLDRGVKTSIATIPLVTCQLWWHDDTLKKPNESSHLEEQVSSADVIHTPSAFIIDAMVFLHKINAKNKTCNHFCIISLEG